MPNINRDISFLMNNVQIGDDILSPISGQPARINFNTPITVPGKDTPPDPRGLLQDLMPWNVGADVAKAITPTLETVTGYDGQTIGKYFLLAMLALLIIAIGLVAMLSPGVKYIVKAAE